MKNLTSISIAILFLFQGISLDMDLCEQIKKISSFVAHYQNHKEFDGDSFFEYVFEEYFNANHQEHENQNRPPAHSHHQCCHPLVFIAPTNTVALHLLKFEEKRQVTTNTSQFNSRFLESLFQPPRV